MPRFHNKPDLISAARFLSLLALIWLPGCANTLQAPPDTRAADEAAIRKADAEWSKSAQPGQVDAWMSFYSPDAVVEPPNAKIATTPDSIRQNIAGLLGLPGLSLHWEAQKVEVARSGDLAYLRAAYELTATSPTGKPFTEHGKTLEIWKKQSDGAWKCAVDTWTSDDPAAP